MLAGVEVRYEDVYIRQGPGLQKWTTWRDKTNYQKLFLKSELLNPGMSMNVTGVDHLSGWRTLLQGGGELRFTFLQKVQELG